MKKALEGLSVVLKFCPETLDESALEQLQQLLAPELGTFDVSNSYEFRCFERGFVTKVDSEEDDHASIDYSRLYAMNASSLIRGEENLSYVLVGKLLLSLPVTDVAISDIVAHVHSDLRKLLGSPFVLYHMTADGTRGSECVIGQSGSRFVAKTFNSPKPVPTSPRAGRRIRRSLSFDYPTVQCARCVGSKPRRSTRGRDSTSDVHAGRHHYLFRSHSVEKRKCVEIKAVGAKFLSLYVRGVEEARPTSSTSRWVASSEIGTGSSATENIHSTIFPTYPPVEFDLSRTRILSDASPLEIELDVRNGSLINVLNDLINRRASAVENQGFQSALEALASGSSAEELRRRYAPMAAHLVSRAVAVAELSRFLGLNNLEAILSLADAQGVKERPLLVELSQGQWNALCPKDFRLCSAMIGPTRLSRSVPLPGREAEERLMAQFSYVHMNNNFWNIKLKYENFSNPVFFPSGGDLANQVPVGLLEQLSPEDCLRGFKIFKNVNVNGVLITSWTGFCDSLPRNILLDRSGRVKDVVCSLRKALKVRHADIISDFPEISFQNYQQEDSLRSDLHWCSNQFLTLSLVKGPKLLVVAHDNPYKNTTTMTVRTAPVWEHTDETEDPFIRSPTARLMARISATGMTGATEAEAQELGVDINTEYSRFWLSETDDDDDHEIFDNFSSGTRQEEVLVETGAGQAMKVEEEEEEVRSPMTPVSRNRQEKISQDPRVIRCSRDTRQFEFHPFDPNLILSGSRFGVVSLLNAKDDFCLMQTRVDTSPILGLSWLRAHMNIALYGASSSGIVGVVKMDDTGIDHQPIGRFQNLSSVTVNCTDDYFLVSGFSRDVTLYDLVTGQRVSELREIHANFINIIRFSHLSPHLFATSSFDSTCKLWDLRSRTAAVPVASFATPTLNVMCCFSPLDDNLLVSGLDSNIVQLSVKQGLVPNIPIETLANSIPAKNSSSNYRRAVYLADGARFITSGTDEDYMRVIDAKTGVSTGVYKFDGLLQAFEQRISSNYRYNMSLKEEREIELSPRMAQTGNATVPTASKAADYVQSLRGHPIFPREVGVLLYPFDRSKSSFICTTEIPDHVPQLSGSA